MGKFEFNAKSMKEITDINNLPENNIQSKIKTVQGKIIKAAESGLYEIMHHEYNDNDLELIRKHFENLGFNVYDNSGFVNNEIFISWKLK